GQVDVVVQEDRDPEPLLELAPEAKALEAAVVREADRPVAPVDDAGNAGDGAVDQRLGEAGRGDERFPQLDDRREDALRLAAAELDVLTRPRLAAQVADSAAQETGAEIDPEHERRLRHRFEERRAVARAVGRRRLADEAGVEQRLERERDGRLRDPG